MVYDEKFANCYSGETVHLWQGFFNIRHTCPIPTQTPSPLPSPLLPPPSPRKQGYSMYLFFPRFNIRELKKRRRQRLLKCHLKKKWNRAASTFIALIPSRLIRQMLHGWLSLELNSKGLYQSSGKEKENWCFVFPSSTKRGIGHCTTTAKKCTKKRDAHAKLLYCQY